MTRAAIYIRWSTEDQGQGTTLQVQREACFAFCERVCCHVPAERIYVDDGYSGGNLHRPALDRLRRDVAAAAVDMVIVYRLDRLSRDLADATGLVGREWKGKALVRSATEDVRPEADEGWLNYSFRAAFADYERRVIRQRTYAGKVRRLKDGLKVAGAAPYGYRRTDRPGVLEVDEDRAQVVRRLFEKCARENMGLPALARWLNELGYKPPRADKWSAGTLRPILMNPVYKGRIVFGRQQFLKTSAREAGPWRRFRTPDIDIQADPGVLPPLVGEELWEQAQIAMRRRRTWMERTSGRSLGSTRLLTGITYCRCGSRLEVKTPGAARSNRPDYYRCIHNEQRERCPHRPGYIDTAVLDRIVVTELLNRVHSAGYRDRLEQSLAVTVREEMAAMGRRRLELLLEVEGLDRELRFVDGEYRKQRLTIEEARRIRAQVEEEKQETVRRLSEVETSLADQQREARERQDALNQVELASRWDELDVSQRRQLLQQFIRRVEAIRVRGERELAVHIVWALETSTEPQGFTVPLPAVRAVPPSGTECTRLSIAIRWRGEDARGARSDERPDGDDVR